MCIGKTKQKSFDFIATFPLLWLSGTTLQYLQSMPVIRISAKINEIKNRRSIEKINKTKSWFFERINKSSKCLARIS